MSVLPREKLFLDLARDLGYIDVDQKNAILTERSGGGPNVAKILKRRGWLNTAQIKEIVSELESRAKTQPESVSSKEKWTSGNVWHGYVILNKLGQGGMGAVYKVRKEERLYALKIMLSSSDNNRRFLREAEAHARLTHPNIVRVYQSGVHEQVPFIVMEYIEGITFSECLKQNFSLEKSLQVLIKVAHALQHAHDHKILHRDVKPSNILLDRAEGVYLSDFGLAKILDHNSQLTQTGQALGTPFYMSPEQVKGDKKEISPQSDVYSLGVVLYQVLTNQLPFTGDTAGILYQNIISKEPVVPKKHDDAISDHLQAICLKAMDKYPNLRYATTKEFADDLERYLQGESVEAARFNLKGKIIQGIRKFNSSPIMAFAFLVCALLFGLGVWWYASTSGWQTQMKTAEQQFLAGNLEEALGTLTKIEEKHLAVDQLRKKIHLALKKHAKKQWQEGYIDKALDTLNLIVPPEPEILRLQASILEKSRKPEEMRLILRKLFELNPSQQNYRFMGEMALRWGYFADAFQYFKKSNPSQKTIKLQKLCLVHWGKYQQAASLYLKYPPRDNIDFLGYAQVYLQQKQYLNANTQIAKINSESFTPFEKSWLTLIKALVLWQMEEKNLMRWKWLSRSKDNSSLEKKLAMTKNLLRKSSFYLQNQNKFNNHLESTLRRKIFFYQQAIELEFSLPGEGRENLEILSRHLQNENISPKLHILFLKVMIRYWIRSEQWQKSWQLCNDGIAQFPWVPQFYHMRALSRFHVDDFSKSLEDLDRALTLSAWNFIPLENMSILVFTRMTQEEFSLFALNVVNRFIFKPPDSISKLMLQQYLKEMRDQLLQSDDYGGKETYGSVDWKPVLMRLLKADSPAVQKLAVNILASQYENPKLQASITSWKKRPKYRKIIAVLEQAIENRRIIKITAKIQRVLINYSIFWERYYEREIYRMGDQGKNILLLIFNDAQKPAMMRMLAARMLVALRDPELYPQLKTIATGDLYPQNLLMTYALRKMAFKTPWPNLTKKEIFHPAKKFKDQEFCRFMVAAYLDPHKKAELLETLLKDRERVALTAADNLRHYSDLTPSPKLNQMEQCLVFLLKSPDPFIRASACRVFWQFAQLGKGKNYKVKKEIRNNYRRRCWKKYHHLLADSLQDTTLQVQLAAIQGIIFDSYSVSSRNVYIQKPQIIDTPSSPIILRQLRQMSLTSPYFLKFWSSVLLSTFDDKQRVWDTIYSTKTSPFIRMACSRGLWLSKRIPTSKIMALMLEVIHNKKEGKTLFSDQSFQQVAILTIGWNFSGKMISSMGSPEIMKNQLRVLLIQQAREKSGIKKRASLAALLWAGNYKNIPMMKQEMLSTKNERHTRRAAACSMAGLIFKYQPDNLLNFLALLSKAPDYIKGAAAYGLYQKIDREVDVESYDLQRKNFEDDYAHYLHEFRIHLKKFDIPRLQTWILILRSSATLSPKSRYFLEAGYVSLRLASLDKVNAKQWLLAAHQNVQMALKIADNSTDKRSINFDKVRAMLFMGELYIAEKQSEKSRNTFEQLLLEDPFQMHCLFYLGIFWDVKGYPVKAREYYRQSYLSSPTFSKPLMAIAFSYIKENNRKKSLETLKEYHEQYGLQQKDITGYLAPLMSDPWIRSLPR